MRMTEVLASDGLAHQLDVLLAALDGPAERRNDFDEAARLARQVAGADIALVSLVVGSEQRFLGSAGLEPDLRLAARTPLTHSFCQHVVAGGVTFAVADSRTDPRITAEAGGAAIDDLGVVAYLGVPLRGQDGTVLGAVCAISHHPRLWNDRHVAALEAVAAGVTAEARLRLQAADQQATLRVRTAIVTTALDGLVVTDMHGIIREFNPAAEAMFGLHAEEVRGRQLADSIVPPELREAHLMGLSRFRSGQGGAMIGARTRVVGMKVDGTRFPLEMTLTSTRSLSSAEPSAFDDEPVEELLVAHMRDLTLEDEQSRLLHTAALEQHAAELALARSEQQLRLLVESAPTMLFAIDADERFTLATGAGFHAVNPHPDSLLGHRVDELYAEHPAFLVEMRRVLAGEERQVTETFEGRQLRSHLRPVRDADGSVVGLVGVCHDITADVEREQHLRHLATHDELTGLLNRSAAEDAVRGLLSDGTTAAVLAVDLDHFKDINDSLGHVVGDDFLAAVSTRVRARVPADTVVARLGGDQLLLVRPVPEDRQQEAAEELARTALAAVAEPVTLKVPHTQETTTDTIELSLTASVGIVLCPAQGRDASTVLARAEEAMYAVKRTGRGTYGFHVAGDNSARRRLSVGGRLRKAVRCGGIQVHYQPVRHLGTGRTVAFEALARWNDDELGPVSPVEFITLAEDIGLIDDLTELVLDRALAANAGWNTLHLPVDIGAAGSTPTGSRGPLLWIGVNVAPRQLHDRGLPARVAAAVAHHGVDPSCVVLEVTEGAAMDDSVVTGDVLRGVRDSGMTAVIDDFGVGYSNLARLRDLSADRLIDAVKLDRSFITELPGPRATALVGSFLHTAHTLGVTAVAEGIETPEQLAALKALSCTLGQGWLFAAAMPDHDVPAWLRAQGQ